MGVCSVHNNVERERIKELLHQSGMWAVDLWLYQSVMETSDQCSSDADIKLRNGVFLTRKAAVQDLIAKTKAASQDRRPLPSVQDTHAA